MKKINNKLVDILFTIIWLIKVLIKTDRKNHIQYKKEGRGVLNILANGPSLSDVLTKISTLEGDFSVVNYFYKSPYFFKIKPSIYVIFDPFFFSNEESCKYIIDVVEWPMRLIVPYYVWKRYNILRYMRNPNIEVVPIHGITYNGIEKMRHWIYKHGLAMPRGQNVLVPSIYNGINMGYQKILLFGVDHSWTKSLCVSEDNKVCALDTHFYDTEQSERIPYMKDSENYYKLHELLRDFSTMFESYQLLQPYAHYMGCNIINKTKGSFIDAFERE